MRFLKLLFSLSFCFSAIYAQEPILVKKAAEKPLIDGHLNEAIWKDLPRYTDFRSYVPDFGSPALFATVAMITYDEENLYIGFDCKDPEPDKLKATITARDLIKLEDWVCINLDPFFDRQGLVCLYANPLGIQMDSRSAGTDEDLGADYVFTSKASINDEGYQVEMEVPFKSLRYPKKDPVTMGFIFERRIQRMSQHSTCPPLQSNQGMNFITQTVGYTFEGIRHYTLLELLPAITYSHKQTHENGVFGTTTNKPSVGLTGTVGITSQLILDMAVNPDFSQVESDAGQISENQRYALYYSEKRPFFQEGKGIFEIAGTNEGSFFQQAFHTRQIINPLAGMKLTGKVSGHDRIGFLYALDDPLEGTAADSTSSYINYAIARLHHAFKNDSYVGAIGTFREGTDTYNRVGGLDGRWRLAPSTAIEFNALASGTKNEPGAKGLTDWLGTLKAMRSTNRLSGTLQLQHVGTDFMTQSGFLTRSGMNSLTTELEYAFFGKGGFFGRIAPYFTGFVNQDINSGIWERDGAFGLSLTGKRSTQISFFINPCDEVYLSQRFNTSGIILNASSQLFQSLRIQSQFKSAYRTRYVDNPYTGFGNTAVLSFNYQPVKKFQSDLTLSYSDFYQIDQPVCEFRYLIIRSKNTYQLTSKLFVRGILEYNSFEKDLSTDFLVSFTYIPGTVVHVGYGSLYQKQKWNGHEYQPGTDYLETIRGFFFKASYLWRN